MKLLPGHCFLVIRLYLHFRVEILQKGVPKKTNPKQYVHTYIRILLHYMISRISHSQDTVLTSPYNTVTPTPSHNSIICFRVGQTRKYALYICCLLLRKVITTGSTHGYMYHGLSINWCKMWYLWYSVCVVRVNTRWMCFSLACWNVGWILVIYRVLTCSVSRNDLL